MHILWEIDTDSVTYPIDTRRRQRLIPMLSHIPRGQIQVPHSHPHTYTLHCLQNTQSIKYFLYQIKYKNITIKKGTYFQDWDTFKKIFSDQFCPKNEQLMALTRLEGTSWYQAKDPVDDYIDHFQELTNLVEYDDDKTIVIKFWCRLDPALQNQVTLLGDGAPNFNDPKGWYEATCKVSWNREANKAFVEMNWSMMHNFMHSALPPPKSKVTFALMRKMFSKPHSTHPCMTPQPPISEKWPHSNRC